MYLTPPPLRRPLSFLVLPVVLSVCLRLEPPRIAPLCLFSSVLQCSVWLPLHCSLVKQLCPLSVQLPCTHTRVRCKSDNGTCFVVSSLLGALWSLCTENRCYPSPVMLGS
eukprot:RCo016516